MQHSGRTAESIITSEFLQKEGRTTKMCCLKKTVSEVEGEKSGADMENRLAEIITDIIFQHTSCDYHKDGGFFTCEIYADYRDYAENSTVIKWCEADNPHEAFNEELFCWYQDCIFECEDDVIDTVKRHWTALQRKIWRCDPGGSVCSLACKATRIQEKTAKSGYASL